MIRGEGGWRGGLGTKGRGKQFSDLLRSRMPGCDSSGNGIEVGLDDLQPGAIGTTTPGTATSPSMHAGLKPRHFVALEGGRTQRYPTSQTRLVDLTARVEKMVVGLR